MLLPARTGAAAVASTDRRSWPLEIKAETWLVIAVTALAAALRFATLTTQSYWLDEAQAVHELGLSFGSMLHAWSSFEWNPPLYLLIAWPWAKLFGTGEFGLRALSALLGTAVVPLLYLAGRELISRRAGLVAAALAAVNPFLIDTPAGPRVCAAAGPLHGLGAVLRPRLAPPRQHARACLVGGLLDPRAADPVLRRLFGGRRRAGAGVADAQPRQRPRPRRHRAVELALIPT